MIEQLTYRIDEFEGPLDLLLSLIQKNKVSITDIPIVMICDQYMEYIAEAERMDLELASEFIVMASELMLIKSKMLLPHEEGTENDPRREIQDAVLLRLRAKQAAEELKSEGIDAAVINIHTVKPLDSELITEYARRCGAVVTAEEHNIIGGLGSSVCETLSASCPVPVQRVGVEDRYGMSGQVPELLELYGLTAENIKSKARLALSMKR